MIDLLDCALRLLVITVHHLLRGVHLLRRRGIYFGHFHRTGAGFAFGGRLLEAGLAAMVCLSLAAISHVAVTDWVEKRFARPELSRAAGILTFMVVLAVLGLGLARLL